MKMKKKRKNPYLKPHKRRSRKNLLREKSNKQYPRGKRLKLLMMRRIKNSELMSAKKLLNSKKKMRRNSQSLAVAHRLGMI
jgi:hypothetical protein